MKKYKADIILFLFILIIFLFSIIYIRINNTAVSVNDIKVLVTSDGNILYDLNLRDNTTITVSNEYGINTFRIENGIVKMIEADCNDKFCCNTESVSKVNEQIICLPHRLIISLYQNGSEGEYDAIVY